MNKKWLWYVCAVLLCCGSLAFYSYATQSDSAKRLSPQAQKSLAQAKRELAQQGRFDEIDAKIQSLSSMNEVKAPSQVQRVDGPSMSAEAPAGYVAPATAEELGVAPEKVQYHALLDRLNDGYQLTPTEKAEFERLEAMLFPNGRESNPLDAQGGPNVYGYRWVDNLGGDTATYAWEEPNAPIELTAISNTDDASASVPFGFTFNFFGTNYTSGWASTNGVFGLSASNTSWSNGCPASGITVAAIMPYFDDGNTSTGASSDGGRVVYQQYADHVTITWDSVGTCCTNGTDLLDYQLQLWNNGKIKLQYRQIQRITGTSSNGSSPTIGIQNTSAAGLDQLNYYCNTAGDTAYTNNLDGRAVWFYLGGATPGRCCYGPNPCAPNCVDGVFITDCAALGGTFTADITCATPCPTAVAGDLVCNAFVIPSLPYSADGTTVGFTNNYDEVCPYTGSTSPDVVYAYTPGANQVVDATLCGGQTAYDTKMYVYENAVTPGTPFACNDDACTAPNYASPFVSQLLGLNLVAGNTYYFVVDGYGGSSGLYTLSISTPEIGRCCYNNGAACADNSPAACSALNGVWTAGTSCAAEPCVNLCALTCGGNDVIEPDDFPNYCATNGTSDINGGCNLATPLYGAIACGQTVCAQTFTCDATGYRDTDWFLFTITEFSDVTLTAQSSFDNLLYGIVDISNCASAFFITNAFITSCAAGPQSVSALQLAPGSYVAFGSYGNFTGLPTPSLYKLTLTCTPAGEPQGRCCYDNNSSCIDNTLTECTALGGNWTQGLTCAGSPCPPPPPTNDDCATATLMVVPPMGSASAAAGNPSATPTCVGLACADDCPGFPNSTGPDQFYYFTLTECRRIAILGDNDVFCDPHLSVSDACCGTALYCNDDWGCNPDLDLIPWLDPSFRPVAGFGSMVAGLFNPGTYYIRAGHYSSGNSGVYNVTIYDFGPCQEAPCDPVTDLTILVESSGNLPNNYKLFFTAPQDEDYTIWYSNNPNNDGNPDDGSDPNFVIETVLLGVPAGPVVYQASPGFDNYRYFVVTAGCTPFTEPVGRCCYNNNNNCDDLTQADCAELGGTWGGPFQSCAVNPCPPPLPTGRCCYNGGLNCVDNFQTECTALGGVWNEFQTCAANPCPVAGPNDECANAIQVFNNTPVSGTTVGATFSAEPTSCIFTVPDVWYVYTSTSTNPITMSLCDNGTNYDTKMGAYAGSCGGTEVFCIDDSACPINGLYTIGTVATPTNGTQYYIRVSGFGGQTGDFVLTVTQ